MSSFLSRSLLSVAGALLLAGAASSAGSRQATPPGTVLFEADLRSDAGFQPAGCGVTFVSAGLVLTHTGTNAGVCRKSFAGAQVFRPPFRIDADVQWQGGPVDEHFGVYFGDRFGRSSYLTLTITNSGAVALEAWDGAKWQRTPPQRPAPRPIAGAINRIAVEVRATGIRAYLNGELVAAGSALAPVDGEAGLFVDEPEQRVLITRFRVSAIAATAETPPSGGETTPPRSPATPEMWTPGGRTIIDNDLVSDSGMGVSNTAQCTTTYRDGGLRLDGPSGCEWVALALEERPLRMRFELSTRMLKATSVGLVLGQTTRPDNLHYHVMASSTGSLVVELLQERQSRTLATWIHGAIRTTDGATNRIAVEVHGQELRCFVNGQFVGRVTSPQVVQGDYGFIVGGTGGSAVFSNLKVVDFN